MSVSASMTPVVFAVRPGTSLEAAARLFIRQHIGGAPVVDEDGKPVGFLTGKDLFDPDRPRSDGVGDARCLRLAGGGLEPLDAGPVGTAGVVADVMTNFVVSVPLGMALDEAVRLMLSSDLHRVLVLDDHRRIVGILSCLDVMRVLAARP